MSDRKEAAALSLEAKQLSLQERRIALADFAAKSQKPDSLPAPANDERIAALMDEIKALRSEQRETELKEGQ